MTPPPAAAEADLGSQTRRTAGLRRSVLLGAELGALSGLLAAILDAGYALSGPITGQSWVLGLYVLAVSVAAATMLGALLAVWLFAVVRVAPPVEDGGSIWARSVLAAVPLGAFLVWVPSGWILKHWRSLESTPRGLAILALAVLAIGSVIIARVALALARWLSVQLPDRRPRRAAAFALVAVVVASVLYAADATLYPGDYEDFHVGLAGLFVLMLGAAVAALRVALPDATRGRLRPAALGLAATLAVTLVVLELSEQVAFGASRAVVFRKVVNAARSLSDVDRDGFGAILGGRDCAWRDPDRAPSRTEVPGNGIDEDCSGADEAWPRSPPRPKPWKQRPRAPFNVLLLTIDTLRADHVSAYGYARRTTPNIDRLAQGSLLFERAFSQASKTWDSVPSLLTGRYPTNLTRDYEDPRIERYPPYAYYLTKKTPTVASAFAAHGYATRAVVPITILRHMGVGRGFDEMAFDRAVTPTALRMLEKAPDQPLFMWLHYNHPHHPYTWHKQHDFGKEAIDRYDSEVAAADEEVGKVLEALEHSGMADSTVVIISADHGEEFGEHGGFEHTRKHYTELLHVPLIVKVPGVGARRIAEVVELVDVVPTLHELCDLGRAPALDGQSLLGALNGPRPRELAGAYAEDVFDDLSVKLRALFDGRYRLIDDRDEDRLELYDVRTDPREQHDVSPVRPDVVRELRSLIAVRALRGRPAPRK